MPLIILTGFPCSGKTYRAQQLIDDSCRRIAASLADQSRTKTVIHIPSQHSVSDSSDDHTEVRDQIYNSAAAEKNARAAEFSAVKRALSKDAVVIADSLNYIKGYRYQLWCEAKAAGTRCCVIHVAAREDECKTWNRERMRRQGYAMEEDDGTIHKDLDSCDDRKPAGFGDLTPESHTALYGDRRDDRSSTSSIKVQLVGKPPEPSLKSFSLLNAEPRALSLTSLSLDDSSKNQTKHAFDLSYPHAQNEVTPSTEDSESDSPPHKLTTPDGVLPYSPATLQSLVLRYEPPSPFSRWDTPLFTIPSTDPHPPYDTIWNALFPSMGPPRKPSSHNGIESSPPAQSSASDAVKPHAATVLPPSTSASALQTLERTTAEIASALFAAYKNQNIGDGGGDIAITIPGEAESTTVLKIEIEIAPATILTQPMLQRLRRKYTQMQRGGIAHGQGYVIGRRAIAEGFGRFLEGEFGS